MSRLESFVVSLFVAILVPLCLFFASWWLSVGIVPERLVVVFAFAGLGVGILLDIFFLKRWAARAYQMSVAPLAVLYLYVSVITYAVFMGMPLFNLAPGVVAGVYMGRRLRHSSSREAASAAEEGGATKRPSEARVPGAEREKVEWNIKRAGILTASVIACAAAFSAFLALRGRSIGLELQHMFDLKFTVTRPMIGGLIAVGGPALVLAQYWCTTKAARIAYGRHDDIERNPR